MKIKKWLNQHGMVLVVTIIVILIGGYIIETMLYEIRTGDIEQIGAPPDIMPIVVCMIFAGLLCIVIEYCKRCKA